MLQTHLGSDVSSDKLSQIVIESVLIVQCHKRGDCHAARRALAARNDTRFILLSDVLSEGQVYAKSMAFGQYFKISHLRKIDQLLVFMVAKYQKRLYLVFTTVQLFGSGVVIRLARLYRYYCAFLAKRARIWAAKPLSAGDTFCQEVVYPMLFKL
jgi:hypothetical protein